MVILYQLQLTPLSSVAGSTFFASRSSLILSLILLIQFNGQVGAKVFLNIFKCQWLVDVNHHVNTELNILK